MQLVNCMEAAVAAHFSEVARRFPEACRCPRCRLDVLALALNALPPRYVVSETGEVYARAEQLSQQYNADIAIALTRAFSQVLAAPRHQKGEGEA
ncbi:late competence development ComFB family protein [Gelria sp. Kuro-4]|uniref:late competence development ComFB family protein n=1 Tax=Gelria sp. Kuro-4 TaxID=2796927 RepID=UPI001BF00EAD|nr:late competence development ComFB family protein [Gelria sp. Kuro-4]BCV25051.1 hypothetical protein kuro4_18240 [Gelria sp. Kuro-4]